MSAFSTEYLQTRTLQSQAVWHTSTLARELGNIYDGPIPVADVRSKLFGWQPQLRPLATVNEPDEISYNVRDQVAVVRPAGAFGRDDKGEVLSLVSNDYDHLGGYGPMLDLVEGVLDDTLDIYSAGVLGDGRQAWVQVTIPEAINTKEGVSFLPNLLATSSLDRSLALQLLKTALNTVCDNTMNYTLAAGGPAFRVKHVKGQAAKILDARAALGIVMDVGSEFSAMVAELTGEKVSDHVFEQFLESLAPTVDKDGKLKEGRALSIARNRQEQIMHLWRHDVRVAPWKNTTWGVVQAVNTFTHHVQSPRGLDRHERNMGLAVSGGFEKLDRTTVKMVRELLV